MPTKVNENQNYTRPKEPIKETNKKTRLLPLTIVSLKCYNHNFRK